MSDDAIYIFKLRHNIDLEGDLDLAKMELQAFLPDVDLREIEHVDEAFVLAPQLLSLDGYCAFKSYLRPSGVKAYLAEGSLDVLPELIRRISFIQRIYCLTRNRESARGLVNSIRKSLGPIVECSTYEDWAIIQALPHYAVFEFSDVVARHSTSATDTKAKLSLMLSGLLGTTGEKAALQVARDVLSAKSTTSLLSHDIHYYKAKFFPRMARSMINVCCRRLGAGEHRVVDNFVGSGTTLLESATLGVPSVGIDIDPLSVLIAQAKLAAMGVGSKLFESEVERVVHALAEHTRSELPLFQGLGPQDESTTLEFPSWLMKNRRMTPEIARDLSAEIGVVASAISGSHEDVLPILRVLMSDAISRRLKMRFLGTGSGRFSLTFAKTPIPVSFQRQLEQYVNVAAVSEWIQDVLHVMLAESHVIRADTRSMPQTIGQFDVNLTSPPYLPASSGRESYAKARAPSLIALGIESRETVDGLVDDSIGSMNGNGVDLDPLTADERHLVEWLMHDELRKVKAKPTARYFVDMRQTFKELLKVLKPGACSVIVSGKQSTFYNFSTRETLYLVRSAEMLAEEAEIAGFEVVDLHDVKLMKANMNARPRSLDDYYETLIFLRKPTG